MSALTAAGVCNINCGVRTPVNPAGARVLTQTPAAGTQITDDMTVDLTSSNKCG
jgi:beta-lactam-binding protein with PASTA domain